MNAQEPNKTWGSLLREALPEPPLPAGFARSILRRIHSTECPWADAVRGVMLFMARPFSMGLLGLALVAGVWDGMRRGGAAIRLEAEATHVMAMDPEASVFMP